MSLPEFGILETRDWVGMVGSGTGVSPVIFLNLAHGKNAGGTPAPRKARAGFWGDN
jgi:hypothetical protein